MDISEFNQMNLVNPDHMGPSDLEKDFSLENKEYEQLFDAESQASATFEPLKSFEEQMKFIEQDRRDLDLGEGRIYQYISHDEQEFCLNNSRMQSVEEVEFDPQYESDIDSCGIPDSGNQKEMEIFKRSELMRLPDFTPPSAIRRLKN